MKERWGIEKFTLVTIASFFPLFVMLRITFEKTFKISSTSTTYYYLLFFTPVLLLCCKTKKTTFYADDAPSIHPNGPDNFYFFFTMSSFITALPI